MNSLAQTVYEIAANPLNTSYSENHTRKRLSKELLQNTPLAIYALNKDGSLTYANQ